VRLLIGNVVCEMAIALKYCWYQCYRLVSL